MPCSALLFLGALWLRERQHSSLRPPASTLLKLILISFETVIEVRGGGVGEERNAVVLFLAAVGRICENFNVVYICFFFSCNCLNPG